MTRYSAHTTLTPERLADLRLIVSGATRRRDGSPFILARQRLAWFIEHGYVEPGPPRPPTDARITPLPRPVATQKGRDAVAAADAQRVAP